MSLISSQIKQYEQKTKTKYLSAVQHLENDLIPNTFNIFLQEKILPRLVRIGFDRKIAETLFTVSAPAWEAIKQTNKPKLILHLALIKDMQRIRKDVICQESKKSRNKTSNVKISRQSFAGISNQAIHPAALNELLQKIPTTWIILPRAHSFLTLDHSLCLMAYLHYLDKETNCAFEKILLRILIEFTGNYSVKFISPAFPEKKMIDAIFYGYTAMFWKNLQHPPAGYEDLLIFKNFLSWARAFRKRMPDTDAEKDTAIDEMERMENHILPDQNIKSLTRRNNRDADGLHITLRHGRPGIMHAVRHFTMGNRLLSGRVQEHLYCRTLPKQLSALFRKLHDNYADETLRTRKSMHAFLLELKSEYTSYKPNTATPAKNLPDDLAFTYSRIASMTHDLSKTLN